MEDSQSLQNYRKRLGAVKTRTAAIAYPGLSNYNDLDVLIADPELDVELIHGYRPLAGFDMVLLPGSKTVIRDLQWLKQQGLYAEIRAFDGAVFGLCGGYQMLCEMLHDPDALEHEVGSVEEGLGLIDDTVIYQSPKILARGDYRLFSHDAIKGYEIHCGRLQKHPLADYVGGLSNPSKMPGYAYGIPASDCIVGRRLREVEGSTCATCYAHERGAYAWRTVKAAYRRRMQRSGCRSGQQPWLN